jgi:RNA polymerase sigma factor (sigma-70 family)
MEKGRFVKAGEDFVWTGERRRVSDDELVVRARRGDPEAFTLLYHRYKLDVWHLAWFTLHDHHEAEDVLQETFLKAHRALGQRHHGGTMRPWLLAICRNACRDRLRAGHRRDALPLDEDLAAVEDGEHERGMDFRVALAALPDEEREAFLLVDVLGCHSDEAARIAGVAAASTLRSRLARARRALAPAVAEPVMAAVGAEEVWGVLHSAAHSVLVVAPAGDGPAPPVGAVRGGDGDDLLTFLDSVDRRIPRSRSTVLAVVEARPAGGAAIAGPWLAVHPRWRMQRAPTHASWLGEVDDLLGRWSAGSDEDRERVRAHLSADAPFTWTCGG